MINNQMVIILNVMDMSTHTYIHYCNLTYPSAIPILPFFIFSTSFFSEKSSPLYSLPL